MKDGIVFSQNIMDQKTLFELKSEWRFLDLTVIFNICFARVTFFLKFFHELVRSGEAHHFLFFVINARFSAEVLTWIQAVYWLYLGTRKNKYFHLNPIVHRINRYCFSFNKFISFFISRDKQLGKPPKIFANKRIWQR